MRCASCVSGTTALETRGKMPYYGHMSWRDTGSFNSLFIILMNSTFVGISGVFIFASIVCFVVFGSVLEIVNLSTPQFYADNYIFSQDFLSHFSDTELKMFGIY